MKNPLQPHESVLREYEAAFEAYLALCDGCRVSGARVSLQTVNVRAFEKAKTRLAIAERELIELDAA